jgi:hypothetical protein
MTAKEELMLKIMGKISNSNAPIVFKGALITRLILSEHGFSRISRTTRDTDANWVGNPPSMNHLVDVLNHSLEDMQNRYMAKSVR